MKAEAVLDVNKIKAEAPGESNDLNGLTDVDSNGKLESFFILKNWYESFNGVAVKAGIVRKIYSFLFFLFVIVSFFALTSLPLLFPFYLSALCLYFFDLHWVPVFFVSFFFFLGFLPISIGLSKEIAEMFFESKHIENNFHKIEQSGLEVFSKKLGFSFLNPKIKDMQAIQDFFIWMMNITRNLANVPVDTKDKSKEKTKDKNANEDGDAKNANEEVFEVTDFLKDNDEFLWWKENLNKLKAYDLNESREFKKIMLEAFLRLPKTVALIVQDKDYSFVWKSVVNGKSGAVIGDLTAGNKERLLKKFADGG